MARSLIKVPIDDDPNDYVEVDIDSRELGTAVQLTAGGLADLRVASFSLASSLDTVLPALSTVLRKIRDSAHAPDEVGIELGLSVGGETGLVFTKGTAEATFTVSLTWRRSTHDSA